MRVLHVYRTYFPDPPGGLQEAIRQICFSTADYGVESRVFTLSPSPEPVEIERPEARVIRCRSWAAPASCDLGGIVSFKNFSKLEKYAPLMHRMLSKMDAIVATSAAYAQTSPILADTAVREWVRVIPLGIDERSYPQAGDEDILQRLSLDDGEPFFLFIGVLRYYKGLHTLLQAAADTNAKVVIAGTGPEMVALKEQKRKLSLKNVLFAGQVSDTEKVTLLKHCRALLLPSHLRSEAYGMVLVEAAMFGKPMVSCEIGTGTSFVNTDNETGIVVPPENPIELAQAMNWLLENNALMQRFGSAARGRYELMFSGAALGQAYVDLYRDVMRQH
ncbi:MAG: glycosyltransferase [Deltaproteobacteria bacterium]|nr:glycosyltransferase [Deltaproteobacteria bacterium]